MHAYVQLDTCQLPKFSATLAQKQKRIYIAKTNVNIR